MTEAIAEGPAQQYVLADTPPALGLVGPGHRGVAGRAGPSGPPPDGGAGCSGCDSGCRSQRDTAAAGRVNKFPSFKRVRFWGIGLGIAEEVWAGEQLQSSRGHREADQQYDGYRPASVRLQSLLALWLLAHAGKDLLANLLANLHESGQCMDSVFDRSNRY